MTQVTVKDCWDMIYKPGPVFLEKIEFEAMRQRHNRLLILAADKNCNMSGVTTERIPSIEERKSAAEEVK